MADSPFTLMRLLVFANTLVASVVVILAFSLLAYTFTYNFRTQVARAYAVMLASVMIAYASEVALDRGLTASSANAWLHFEWLGIAMLPAGYYLFSLAVLRTTNYRLGRRRWMALSVVLLSLAAVGAALFGSSLVGELRFSPPISYLEPGPLFPWFVVFFVAVWLLSLRNVVKARQRTLTVASRRRMNYLLVAFVGPALGVFPYMIPLSVVGVGVQSSAPVLALSVVGHLTVSIMLVILSYTVAYFGVLTPDRVVRYRLIRFFMRGPVVAILVILAVLTVPTLADLLGLPADVTLFSIITGVIIVSQLFLSVTKGWVDRLVYREDQDEIAWLRELDRRLLTTSDVRQFLENSVVALCELLRVPAGFVAAAAGPDLMLEVVVGPESVRDRVKSSSGWTDVLVRALKENRHPHPISHAGFWVWPLLEPASASEERRVLGMLGVAARTEAPLLSQDELLVLDKMLERITRALSDRKLQQGVFISLRNIIPDIDRIQELRGMVPYQSRESDTAPAQALLNPSPIHSPEFEAWVKDALSHYWGGPKLTESPLLGLRVVAAVLENAEGDPTKALRLVLGAAIERLKPEGKQVLSAPEWMVYNILEMRFLQGRKVREIADRLAMSESDLYRKQRVAIGHVARVLSEMEQDNTERAARLPAPDGVESADEAPAALQRHT